MAQKILNTFRHEFKYYINYFEYHTLRNRLKAVLKRDKFADENGNYHIRSLYFDDIKNEALFEKQAGVLERNKYRIRIYNLEDNIIKLESKKRVGQFISKTSQIITKKEYNFILNNESFKSEGLLNKFLLDKQTQILKPKVIVDYVREAYVSDINNIRITFDKELKTGLYKTDIFDKELPMIDVIEEPKMILEIKFDNFLPDFIKNLLQIDTNQRYAISKYTICRKFTKENSWEDN